MELLRKNPTATWIALTLLGGAAMMFAFYSITAVGKPKDHLTFFMGPMLICILALGLRDILSTKNRLNREQEECRSAANQLGFYFTEEGPVNLLGWSTSFDLTRNGLALQERIDPSSLLGKLASSAIPKSANILSRTTDDHTLAVYEHHFLKNDVFYRKCVVAIQSDRLALPYFALFPKGWLTDRRVYDQHCLITSDSSMELPNMEAIANELYRDRKLEVGEGYMLLYSTHNHPIAVAEIELRVLEALEIYKIVCQQLSGLPV